MQRGAEGNSAKAGVGVNTEGDRTITLGQNDDETVGGKYKRTIGGDMDKTVHGDSDATVHGKDARTFKNKKTDTTVNSKTESKLGGGTEHSPDQSGTIGALTKIHAKRSEHVKRHTRVQGTKTKVAAQENKDTEEGFETTGFKMSLGGGFVEICKTETIIKAIGVSASASTFTMVLNKLAFSLIAGSGKGASTEVVGVEVGLHAEKEETSGDHTEMSAVQVGMAGNRDEEHGSASELAGLNLRM